MENKTRRLCMTAPLAGLLLAAGCADDAADDTGGVEPEVAWPNLACDPIVPSYCGFPFPSNVFTIDDDTTATGRRVNILPETMPVSYYGIESNSDPWKTLDGFSPGAGLLAEFPGATVDGFPTADDFDVSLTPDSPTIVMDGETGALVPHWSGLDMTHTNDDERALLIRPAVRLDNATRYIVAIRNVKGADGSVLPASEGFAALRDNKSSDEPSIDERRGLYEDIFRNLESSGIPRDDLQLAWDFTTASDAAITGYLVHMRDDALATDPGGATYTIDSVETDWNPEDIAFRIFGTYTVPLYLTQPEPGGNLVLGPDGMPEQNGTASFGFEVLIPQSALVEPAPLLQYGHGLLGEKEQVENSFFRSLINQYNYVFFGVDLIGFAADDELHVGAVLDSGRVHNLSQFYDRQTQGMLNQALVMRMMIERFSKDPDYGQYIDPTRAYYHGISQGGIMGGTYMALSQDVERGVLGVMGQPYNLLLDRSVDFDPFFAILRASYPDARHSKFLLGLAQMLWDRTEPSGWSHHIEDPLPNTPAHSVLMRDALGDHQVTTHAAHLMARAVGAKHVDTGVRDIWGLEKVAAHTGSALVEYEFGLPPDPVCNVPQTACEDPHGLVRRLEESKAQLDHFLRTGEVKSFCTGACSFPTMSGCDDTNAPDPLICENGRNAGG